MANSKLYLNGVDMSLYKMWVDNPRGWGDAPSRQDQLIDINTAGAMMIPGAERMAPRSWSITGTLIADSADEAVDLWDAAKLVVMDQWLDVVIDPWLDRMCVCRCQDMRWSQGRMEEFGFGFSMSFLAPSPYLQARQVDSYGLAVGFEVQIDLGTAPSPFEVQFIGPCTAPTLTYYDANGTPQGLIAITNTMVAGEWLTFDSLTGRMIKYPVTAVASPGERFLSNSTRLFQLSPWDGVPGSAPTLTLDNGHAVVYVRRQFQ